MYKIVLSSVRHVFYFPSVTTFKRQYNENYESYRQGSPRVQQNPKFLDTHICILRTGTQFLLYPGLPADKTKKVTVERTLSKTLNLPKMSSNSSNSVFWFIHSSVTGGGRSMSVVVASLLYAPLSFEFFVFGLLSRLCHLRYGPIW